MKTDTFLPILILLLHGCTTTSTIVEPSSHNPNTQEEFTDQILAKKLTIELRDGREFDAIHFEVGNDSCTWIDPNTNFSISIYTGDIKKVVKRNHLLGTAEGFGIGLGGGAVAGGLLGFFLASISTSGSGGGGGAEDAAGMGALVGIVGGAFIGVIVGTINGGISGHRYEYEFVWLSNKSTVETSNKDELQKSL